MRSRGIHSVQIDIEIPFYDVDMMQVVWHGHSVKYLEQARCALLSDLNYDYSVMQASGYVWPVIDLQLRYVQPATFGQHLHVRAELIEWESRLKIHYLITDAASGQRITRASSIQVAVDVATREMQLTSPEPMCTAIETRLTQLGAAR